MMGFSANTDGLPAQWWQGQETKIAMFLSGVPSFWPAGFGLKRNKTQRC